MANSINRKVPRCSFCGKDSDAVERLIAGPGVYICNECIALCNSILEEEMELNYAAPKAGCVTSVRTAMSANAGVIVSDFHTRCR